MEVVVKILMLDEETLRNYVKRYQAGGINALITDHYLGSFSKLSAVQLLELNVHLEQNTYLTVEAIIAYVDEAYDVLYSVRDFPRNNLPNGAQIVVIVLCSD